MKFQISRNGEVIGEYSLVELKKAVKAGSILETDFAWSEGWAEWRGVGTLEGIPPKKAPAKPKVIKPPQPATEKQLAYIASFGVGVKAGLTKAEATAMLNELTNDPKAIARKEAMEQQKREAEMNDRASFPSYYLKRDIIEAENNIQATLTSQRENVTKIKQMEAELKSLTLELAKANERLTAATDSSQQSEWIAEVERIEEQIKESKEELDDIRFEVSCYKDELTDSKEEMKDYERQRLEFWKDTFRSDPEDECAAQLDLYEKYGQYFKMPTNKEVTDILDACDKALPTWDKTNVSAFFATYQNSFPDRVKQQTQKKTKAGKGCLVILFAAPAFLYILFRIAI